MVVLKLATLPGFVTPAGTVHAYVTPVAGLAVIVALVLAQVNSPLLTTLATGTLMSCVRFVLALAVQPLLVLVTVTL